MPRSSREIRDSKENMKRGLIMTFIRNAAVAAAVACFAAQAQGQKLSYPEARKGDVVDDYHGTKIADPYRWMEDIDAREVTEWVRAQNRLASGYLERLPLREHFRKRITELWNYPETGLPFREAGRLFYSKNSGLQRQSPVYMRENLDAEPRLVIDPNALSPDGSVSLGRLKSERLTCALHYHVVIFCFVWQHSWCFFES
jgi:prolyl oligopeptidase